MSKVVSLLLTLLLCSCCLESNASVVTNRAVSDAPAVPGQQVFDISEAKKEAIRESVPSVLNWASTWQRRLRCPGSVASEENEDGLAWKSRFQKMLGSEVSASYHRGYPGVIVEIPKLEVAIPFKLSGGDVRAQRPEPICGGSDPTVTIFPMSIRLDAPKNSSDAGPENVEDIVQAVESLVCSRYAMSTKDQFFSLIPQFRTDDPAIYIPVDMRSADGSIEALVFWFDLSFERQSGKLDSSLVKTISLRSEVNEFRSIAKSLRPTETQFQCRTEQLK